MRHHTKDKGDMAVGFVIADAFRSGCQVATLISEHLPFDVILISPKLKLCRLSVKYSAASNGKILVKYVSAWNDRHGTHIRHANQSEFDATAVYCPDTDHVYYIRNDEIDVTRVLSLRLTPPRNGQRKGVHMASDYQNIHRLFSGSSPTGDTFAVHPPARSA